MKTEELNEKNLKAKTLAIVESITSPAYVKAMNKIKAASNEERLSVAMKVLTPDKLREAGVPLPKGTRISSRYFETDTPAIEVGDLPHGQISILQELEKRNPGVLDKIRQFDRDVFNQIVEIDTIKPQIDPIALCVCACGGGAGFCGGAGAG